MCRACPRSGSTLDALVCVGVVAAAPPLLPPRSWLSAPRKSFPFPLVYSFVTVWARGVSFCSMIVLLYYRYLFWGSDCPGFGGGSLFTLVPGPSVTSPPTFEHLLALWRSEVLPVLGESVPSSAPGLESAVCLPGVLIPFGEEWCSVVTISVLGVLPAAGDGARK